VSAHQIPQLVVELVETHRQPSTSPPVCSFLGGILRNNSITRPLSRSSDVPFHLASGLYCSQAESTPGHCPLAQTVGQN
jgi:hypothetical protein